MASTPYLRLNMGAAVPETPWMLPDTAPAVGSILQVTHSSVTVDGCVHMQCRTFNHPDRMGEATTGVVVHCVVVRSALYFSHPFYGPNNRPVGWVDDTDGQ